LPQHAKSVALVLSLTTRLVSPQYHVQFDDLFETIAKENEQYVPKSEWQTKTNFKRAKHTGKPTVIPSAPNTSVIPPSAATTSPTPAPIVTPELEQMILDQPLPEPEPEPYAPPQPDAELEAPLREEQQQIQQPLRRSTRERRQPARFADYIPYSQIAFEAIMEPRPDETDKQLQAFMLSNDPDVLYLWQAMKELD
jgi:hypothetical protein